MRLLHLVVALLAASVSAGKRKKKLASPTQAAPDAVAKPVTPTPAAPTPAAPATNATARGPYCRSGLTGDYAFESCGKFCKEAKAENHCAVRPAPPASAPADRLSPASRRAQFCKCHACGFCKAHYAANKASQPLDSFAAKKKVGGGKKAKKFGGGARLRRKMRGKKKGGAKKEAAPDKP